MLLAIDTATALTGLALYGPQGPLAESIWESGRNHTAQLLPQIDTLLRYIGASPGDITVLAVSLGPGSWSGLRVGLSLAKGMALAGDLPLIGISTLEALAYQYVPTPLLVYPLIRLAFQHTGLAVVLQGLVRPRLRGTELEFWRNSEEARTDRPSQQLRSLNGEWRLMRYFLLTHLCGISHRIWCTLSTICSDAA